MMREIKFRGKRIDNGEWVYGSFVKTEYPYKESRWVDTQSYKGWGPKIHNTIDKSFFIIEIKTDSNDYDDYKYINVDPKTVGQFTGLKDKNRKEIYEGDILKWLRGNYEIKVDIFHSYRFMLGKDFLCKAYAMNGKVIGNKFENPELLKEQTK